MRTWHGRHGPQCICASSARNISIRFGKISLDVKIAESCSDCLGEMTTPANTHGCSSCGRNASSPLVIPTRIGDAFIPVLGLREAEKVVGLVCVFDPQLANSLVDSAQKFLSGALPKFAPQTQFSELADSINLPLTKVNQWSFELAKAVESKNDWHFSNWLGEAGRGLPKANNSGDSLPWQLHSLPF